MQFPYGVADFLSLRREGQTYVDRTDRIPVLEELGKATLFLRPRRFGKSLWLSTLAAYYDVRTRQESESLFKGLAIGESPTPLAHRYLVMRWDFSKIDPDPPRWGINADVHTRQGRIANQIRGYLSTALRVFQTDYADFLPETPAAVDDPFHAFEELLAIVRQTPYRLLLLIDEYDNFANELLVEDRDTYENVVRIDGPFKYLFKWVKGSMAGAGLDRLFVTGVSPMVLSDLTSGMNILKDLSLKSELSSLCGFTDREIRGLVHELHREQCARDTPAWSPDDAHRVIRDWYSGYRFAPPEDDLPAEGVYNPLFVLRFLKYLHRRGDFPEEPSSMP